MLSHEERHMLRKHQVAEVICQFRFPEILMINAAAPAQFQEAIRDMFPQYCVNKEKILNDNQCDPTYINNYRFSTIDGSWHVNLTSGFISLSCTNYSGWDNFAKMLDKPLAAFIQIYKPAYFSRIGLRYLNFISRRNLDLEGTPFNELISSCYLGPLAEDDIPDAAVTQCTINTQITLRNGCNLKVHAGPGLIKRNTIASNETHFIFDQDLFVKGNLPISTATNAISTLHRQAYSVFRGAITDKLFYAMDPEDI